MWLTSILWGKARRSLSPSISYYEVVLPCVRAVPQRRSSFNARALGSLGTGHRPITWSRVLSYFNRIAIFRVHTSSKISIAVEIEHTGFVHGKSRLVQRGDATVASIFPTTPTLPETRCAFEEGAGEHRSALVRRSGQSSATDACSFALQTVAVLGPVGAIGAVVTAR